METQQSSDTTYRIYDYDRKDKMVIRVNYILNQSKDVIDITTTEPNTTPKTEMINGNCHTQFVANHFFTVEEWSIKDILDFQNHTLIA